MIPVTELARRLCLAEHPHLGTTGRQIPCGNHITMSRNLNFLLRPEGEYAMRVLLEALPGKVEEIATATITTEVEIDEMTTPTGRLVEASFRDGLGVHDALVATRCVHGVSLNERCTECPENGRIWHES